MRNHTEYISFDSLNDPIIDWLWKILKNFKQELLSDFLFFVSGCSKLPSNGFENFRLKVQKTTAHPDSLPVSHTCFNQIDFPIYSSIDVMREKILIALKEGSIGFYIK
jgi:hypothetical protein